MTSLPVAVALAELMDDDGAMADGVEIRRWESRDRDRVQALLRLLSEDAVVSRHDAPTYVADTKGEVVATVTLCVFTTLTGWKAYLDHLVVAPAWRRRGIGRALMEHAIQQARAAGASRIDLTANAQKQAGHALYRALGFRERDTNNFRLELTSEESQAASG
jgi:ribosomal protein S18 acetylase RimI-like enzyme